MGVSRVASLCFYDQNSLTSGVVVITLFLNGLIAVISSVSALVNVSNRITLHEKFKLSRKADIFLLITCASALFAITRTFSLAVAIQIDPSLSTIIVSEFISGLPPWLFVGVIAFISIWMNHLTRQCRDLTHSRAAEIMASGQQPITLHDADDTPEQPSAPDPPAVPVWVVVAVPSTCVAMLGLYIMLEAFGILASSESLDIKGLANAYLGVVHVVLLGAFVPFAIRTVRTVSNVDLVHKKRFMRGLALCIAGVLWCLVIRGVESLLVNFWVVSAIMDLVGCNLFMTFYLTAVEVVSLLLCFAGMGITPNVTALTEHQNR